VISELADLPSIVGVLVGVDAVLDVRPVARQHPTDVLNAPVTQPGLELARPAMNALNRELTAASSNASFIEVLGADHTIILTDHSHAEQVAQVVVDLHRASSSAEGTEGEADGE